MFESNYSYYYRCSNRTIVTIVGTIVRFEVCHRHARVWSIYMYLLLPWIQLLKIDYTSVMLGKLGVLLGNIQNATSNIILIV